MNLLKPKYKSKRFHPNLSFAGEFLIFAFIFGLVWLAIFFSLNFKAYASRVIYDLGLADIGQETQTVSFNFDNKTNELIIPKINVRAPIIASRNSDNKSILLDLEKGVALYSGSQPPGSKAGKTVILGHSSEHIFYKGNYPSVFALIDKLDKGDEIAVTFGGRTYKYRVEEKFVKSPMQIMTEVKENGLYLMSCWPVGTDYKRIIVRAMLI